MDFGIIQKLAKCIVRPPKTQYTPKDLVPPCFQLKKGTYQHHSFDVVNNRGLKLKGSYVKDRYCNGARDTIIFLHANGSCRIMMKNYLQMFLPVFDMVAFDFAGCGMSQGEYITVGYNQREDVYAVINRIRQQYGVKNIYLWGRSMGAATALLYTAKYGGIRGIISDNSYSDLQTLITQLSDDYLPFLPTFLLDGIINSIQQYIENNIWKVQNTDFHLRKLKPSQVLDKIGCPIIYIGSTQDKLVNVRHTKQLFSKTKSKKWLQLVKGDHNDARTSELKLKVLKYMKQIKDSTTVLRCSSKQKFQQFKQINKVPNLSTTKEIKDKQLNSPLQVKLINCAQIEHKLRSPILSKTQQKQVSQDISSMNTDHSEKKPRQSILQRRQRIDEMNKRTRTRSKLKRKKIFEGLDYIYEQLNGKEE